MTEMNEILYQHYQGVSVRKISCSLGVSRNTVKQLIEKAKRCGYQGPQTSKEQLDEISQKIMSENKKQYLKQSHGVQQVFANLHEEIIELLEKPYMTIRQCLRLLKEQYQVQGSETSLHRYVKAHIRQTDKPVIPLPTTPGHQAQVDYGYVGLLFCPISKKQKKAYAFIMTLSHSRHRFVYFVFRQDEQTWSDCHRRAFEFFGGVPKVVVLDNLKAGVIQADFYDPTLNRTYAECEKHYGFVADPAKVRVAKHKGKVERSVTIVKQQVIAGRTFEDIHAANAYAETWCRDVIAHQNTRTTGETPMVRFERDEKSMLATLPPTHFDPPHWQSAKVQKDAHITFAGSFYSVPPGYLHQTVWVRADARLVNIYTTEQQLIKTHPKSMQKGQWQTDWQDIAKERREYVLQTSEQLLSLAAHIGESTHLFVEKVIEKTLTETKKRKINKLLRFAKSYSEKRLEAACLRALAFENLSIKAIEKILDENLEQAPLEKLEETPTSTQGCFLHDETDFYCQ